MKTFLILQTQLMNLDHDTESSVSWEGGHEPPENIMPVSTIMVCLGEDKARDALQEAIDSDKYWQIFELVSGVAQPRDVTFDSAGIKEII